MGLYLTHTHTHEFLLSVRLWEVLVTFISAVKRSVDGIRPTVETCFRHFTWHRSSVLPSLSRLHLRQVSQRHRPPNAKPD